MIAAQVVVIVSLTPGGKMCQSSAKNWIRIRPRKNDGIEYSMKLSVGGRVVAEACCA